MSTLYYGDSLEFLFLIYSFSVLLSPANFC